jgi:YidC/Oxa1 family membrane protein insertase
MDNMRLILFAALAFVLLLLYQAWVQDYGPISTPPQQADSSLQPSDAQQSQAVGQDIAVPDVAAVSDALKGVAPKTMPTQSVDETVSVETDLFKAEFSKRGGTLVSLYLRDYSINPDTPDQKFRLLKQTEPNLYIAQSGLIGSEKELAPTHESLFTTEQSAYKLDDASNELSVEFRWSHPSGVEVTKTYKFTRGKYLIDAVQTVKNDSRNNWTARAYTQLQRSEPYEPGKSSFIYTYTGGAYYTPEQKYEKVSFEDMTDSKLNLEVTDGWIALLQHYFVGAWIPPRAEQQHFFTNYLPGPRYLIGMYTDAVTVSTGATHSFKASLYVGPKLQNELANVAPGLELTVDYGWLTILAKPIFWLLDKLHSLVNNWGVAIILLTILIKLAFYKLSETSYKSMANMRKMTPRLQALKDRYGDDKERLNQAMMEMYKKEKINPLGGCLPILIQIPVFIALYWVLLESVEMRQAPFALWLNNLSAPDPYFVLPLLMGVSMFIQQKLNPAPVDPMQAKIMMSLPFVFTVFFAFFPSGLVLYWTVNNVLSIAQQWHITRNIEKGSAK